MTDDIVETHHRHCYDTPRSDSMKVHHLSQAAPLCCAVPFMLSLMEGRGLRGGSTTIVMYVHAGDLSLLSLSLIHI